MAELLLALALSGLAISGLGYGFGPRGMLVGTIVCSLVVAWRFDNDVGACIPMVLLIMIILAVLGLLLYLMLVTH